MSAQSSEFCIESSGGVLLRRKDIYVAQLEGDYETMGRQHGELAAAACGDVVALYMNGLLSKLIAQAVPSISRSAAWLIQELFRRRNSRDYGADLKAHLRGLAQAYNLPLADAERLLVMPDIFHYLAGKTFTTLTSPPSCSCFFACGAATQDGKLIVGRNFDFFGRGVWNDNQALIVMRPSDGQAFCWIGALGVCGSGQGFNESGLIVGLHSKFTTDLRTQGAPIFKLVHEILAYCTTVEEAVARITAAPRLCGLSLFITGSRERTAAIVGYSATHHELIRPEKEYLVRTNHYVTADMQRLQRGPVAFMRHTQARFQRITALIEEKYGTLRVEDGPSILSDCIDPYEDRKRLAGNLVAATNNVQSIVFSPDDDTLWLAHGDFPVCLNDRYCGFSMSALLQGDEGNYEKEDLPGGSPLTGEERRGLYEFLQAWSAHLDNLDNSRAVQHLLRAAEIVPGEPVFPRLAGLILLKEKKYARALPLLLKNAEYPYRDALAHAESLLWVGRCLDLMGRRDEALDYYRQSSALNAQPVCAAAERNMNTAFKAHQMWSVTPEFVIGAALAKY
ncbi:MAG TPA: C45 family autoproteolytic acyltransferase/hydrolase [Candidatus Hydrogenedentes bacterium]|jgi:predicted choloylglycine hydrolase|nr:MAG: Acyl-coenzyme A:6-aminopenicillanic acid acyl-transferase [Candidatus Hydrogenedentes bacterium ADurb.Bin170]HNZ49267.1 C45 family autoproteolytic acyltransferase/hydrolase [Candidatus Hydrogenedentota bacterium]HOD96209.1 C45 family autoproteolytic acyltransferase/hydrolase [Candidatus Hydrogenedentota bacterium]HOM47303.1 C45 family autoproteolytic acyltransferase/hydrolase [Candidatus Hydrogenedentota bacterium]HOR51602.1 C45 family autoproteolytic acyltransferase/hydrolase [Candidat